MGSSRRELLGAGPLSVGASGAIFGILGGLAVVNWRYRTDLPLGFRQPLRWWLMILALNAALPVILPLITMARVDVAAHVAGFLFGCVITFGLIEGRKPLRVASPASPLLYATTFGLIALNAFAVGKAVLYAARFDSERRVEVSRVLLQESELLPEGLNMVAWGLVVDPGTSAEGLELAHEAATRAVAGMPEEMTLVDTLATVHFRRGDIESAVALELRALEQGVVGTSVAPSGGLVVRLMGGGDAALAAGSPFYASQLGRFLKARLAKDGPILPQGMQLPALRIVPPPEGAPATLVLELRSAEPAGLTLYVLAQKNDDPVGLVRVSVASGGSVRYDIQLPTEATDPLSVKRLQLKIALAVRPGSDNVPKGTAELRFWAHDKQVDELP